MLEACEGPLPTILSLKAPTSTFALGRFEGGADEDSASAELLVATLLEVAERFLLSPPFFFSGFFVALAVAAGFLVMGALV